MKPPPVPWRPVTDLPQSGLFCTREALQSYLFSPVTAVIHAPVQAVSNESNLPAAAAAAAALDPIVGDHSSDDEVLSAEQPNRGRKRSRADHEAATAGAAAPLPVLARANPEADQRASNLVKAKQTPRPNSAESYESGQLAPSEEGEDAPPPATATDAMPKPMPVPDPDPAPAPALAPALVQQLPHSDVPQYPLDKGEPYGLAANDSHHAQERTAAVSGVWIPNLVSLGEAAGPNLADMLNPNNAAYDPNFAAQHRAMRAQTDPLYAEQKARKQVTKLIKRLHWKTKSAFTAEEHGYMLDLQGIRLDGREYHKYESLRARMAVEQKEYLRQLREKAHADHRRYTSCHPQAAHQIEAELAAQRSQVQHLPRLWQLAKLISLQSAAESKPREPSMCHQATISHHGTPAIFSMPCPLTPIPLDSPCVPSLLSHQGAASGRSSAADPTIDHPTLPPTAPTTTTAQTDTTQNTAHVPLHKDDVCQNNTACQQADLLMTDGAFECLSGTWAPAYRLGWELPVTIRPKPTPDNAESQPSSQPEQHGKQVIIDSPLPKMMLNMREKHEMVYQHAVRKLGCDLWTDQLRARQAAQAHTEQEPNADGVAGDQQHQQAEEQMYPPYSPSNDTPMDAPYSPSNDPYIDDQHSMHAMPASISPTAADLQSTDIPPSPQLQGHFAPHGADDGVTGADTDTAAGTVRHGVLDSGDDAAMHKAGSMEARMDPSAAAADPGSAPDTDATAEEGMAAAAGRASLLNAGSTAAAVSATRVTAADHTAAEGSATAAAEHTTAAAQEDATAADVAGTAVDGDATAAAHLDASAAVAGECGGGAGGSGDQVPRPVGVGYDSWQLGPFKLVVRTQLPMRVVHNPPPQPPGQPPLAPMPRQLKSQVGLVAVKMEYLEEWGFEMLLPDELARWWAAMTLHPQPNCQLVVAKVGVHSSHLLAVQAVSRSWLRQECCKEKVDLAHASRLIRLLMGHLQGLAPGQYLLTHQPGAGAVSCFTAHLDDAQDEPGMMGVPLPCGPMSVRTGTVYDLHAAHVNSGATDTEQDLFAGAWQQADPEVDQVPFTFPPVHGPSRMGKRAKRGVFGGRGGPRQNGSQAARGRGQGRGFAEHPAKLLPKPTKPPKTRQNFVPPQPETRRGVSAADYAQALDQGL